MQHTIVKQDLIDHALSGTAYEAQKHDIQDISVEILKEVLFSPELSKPSRPHDLVIEGARIGAHLDYGLTLSDATISIPLEFKGCSFPGVVGLTASRTMRLSFRDCRMRALLIDGAHIRGDLILDGTCLSDCHVKVDDADMPSISALRVKIDGRWSMNRCIAKAGVVARQAVIRNSLSCSGAFVASRKYGKNLWPDRSLCEGAHVPFRHCPQCLRQLSMKNYNSISEKHIINKVCNNYNGSLPPYWKASGKYDTQKDLTKSLHFYNAKIGGNVYFESGFTSLGEASLNAASIGGSLRADGFIFCQNDGVALNLDGVKISTSMFLRNSQKNISSFVIGTTSLRGAYIGHRLVCQDVSFLKTFGPFNDPHRDDPLRGRERYAFFAKWLNVKGDVHLNCPEREGRTNNGQSSIENSVSSLIGRISFEHAKIGGCLSIRTCFQPRFLPSAKITKKIYQKSMSWLHSDWYSWYSWYSTDTSPSYDNILVMHTNPCNEWPYINIDYANIKGEINLEVYVAENDYNKTCDENLGRVYPKDIKEEKDNIKAHALNCREYCIFEDLYDRDPAFYEQIYKQYCQRSCVITADFGKVGSLNIPKSDINKVFFSFEGLEYSKVPAANTTNKNKDYVGSSSNIEFQSWINVFKFRNAVQPYDQLVKVLRENGKEIEAVNIAIAREDCVTDRRNGIEWLWRTIIRHCVGYGYHPFKAIKFLLLLLFIGSIVFFPKFVQLEKIDESPKYYSLLHSAELMLPYGLRGERTYIVNGKEWPDWWPQLWPFVLQVYGIFHQLVSWILIGLMVLSPTRILRKD